MVTNLALTSTLEHALHHAIKRHFPTRRHMRCMRCATAPMCFHKITSSITCGRRNAASWQRCVGSCITDPGSCLPSQPQPSQHPPSRSQSAQLWFCAATQAPCRPLRGCPIPCPAAASLSLMRSLGLHKAPVLKRDQGKAVQPFCPGLVSPGNASDMERVASHCRRSLEEFIGHLLRPVEVG